MKAADFNLPGHILPDEARSGWHDLCDDPPGTGEHELHPESADDGAGSQTIVTQLPSTTDDDDPQRGARGRC